MYELKIAPSFDLKRRTEMPDADLIKEMRVLLERLRPDLEKLAGLIEKAEQEEKKAELDHMFDVFTKGLSKPLHIGPPLQLKKRGQ